MEGLEGFLKKFRKFGPPDKAVREEVVVLCKKILNKDIPLSKVKVVNGVVYVDVPPLLKGELLMRKKEILESLNKLSSNSGVLYKDLR